MGFCLRQRIPLTKINGDVCAASCKCAKRVLSKEFFPGSERLVDGANRPRVPVLTVRP